MKYGFLIVGVALCAWIFGCSSKDAEEHPRIKHFTVVFERYGGFSGLHEYYTVSDTGLATKRSQFPGQTEKLMASKAIDDSLLHKIRRLLARSKDTLLTTRLFGTGNLTTALSVMIDTSSNSLSWGYLDPPIYAPKSVDSLYRLMLDAMQEIVKEP